MEKTPKIPSLKSELKKTRIVYTIDNPFCQITWPTINSPTDQTLILELLCALLSPIGSYRKSHIRPNASKGKRARKARNKEERLKRQKLEQHETPTMDSEDLPLPTSSAISQALATTEPEISKHILLGLNSITSHLSSSASSTIPVSASENLAKTSSTNQNQSYISLLFVTRSDSQPSILNQHLPLQTFLSSLNPNQPRDKPTLLIPLPPGSSVRLSTALDLPRANFIGVMSSAMNMSVLAEQLEKLCREKVERVSVPWLEKYIERGGMGMAYQPMRVKELLTTVGGGKNNKKRKDKQAGQGKEQAFEVQQGKGKDRKLEKVNEQMELH